MVVAMPVLSTGVFHWWLKVCAALVEMLPFAMVVVVLYVILRSLPDNTLDSHQ